MWTHWIFQLLHEPYLGVMSKSYVSMLQIRWIVVNAGTERIRCKVLPNERYTKTEIQRSLQTSSLENAAAPRPSFVMVGWKVWGRMQSLPYHHRLLLLNEFHSAANHRLLSLYRQQSFGYRHFSSDEDSMHSVSSFNLTCSSTFEQLAVRQKALQLPLVKIHLPWR